MSWATCYQATNNIHFNYPPLMSDGRANSNWHPAAQVNKSLISQSGIGSSYDYRRFLQQNATALMKTNHVTACNQVGPAMFGPVENVHPPKYAFRSCDDKHVPYGYETSDLKNQYLSRQELENRLHKPYMAQENYLR
jgi:hypothetical protein